MRFGRGSKLVRGAFGMAIGRTTLGEKRTGDGASGPRAGKTRARKAADAQTGDGAGKGAADAATSAAGPVRVAPGLHFVSTPIGAARDITLRALDILGAADVLAAEDTRTLRHLMEIHGVPLRGRPLVAYHEHNAAAAHPRLLAALQEGKSVAYASEAGTPLVSDPGFGLAREAIAQGFSVQAAPGASAVLCALAVSGLPSDRFLFAGFAPATRSARVKFLTEMKDTKATLILYESPKRVNGLLADAVQCFGETREAAVCRELTKKFEEVSRGTLGELALAYAGRDVKGEIVVLVGRGEGDVASPESVELALQAAMKTLSVKDAAAAVASSFGLARRDVYQMALKMDQS